MIALDHIKQLIMRMHGNLSRRVRKRHSRLLEPIAQFGYLEDPISSLNSRNCVPEVDETHRKTLPAIPINPSGHNSAEKLHA